MLRVSRVLEFWDEGYSRVDAVAGSQGLGFRGPCTEKLVAGLWVLWALLRRNRSPLCS